MGVYAQVITIGSPLPRQLGVSDQTCHVSLIGGSTLWKETVITSSAPSRVPVKSPVKSLIKSLIKSPVKSPVQ